jgi:hypothetical protein
MKKNKKESKLDWLNRHYELVSNEKQFAKPYKTPKKLPPNTDSFYKKAEDFNAAANRNEGKLKSILNKGS